jgi:putative phosphonate metabolism protein
VTGRQAIYWAPSPETPLARFGRSWIGRDAETGEIVAQPTVPEVEALGLDLDEITAAPRLYGFHATMKAPFEALGGSPAALEAAIEAFCAATPPVEGPPPVPAVIGGFVALVPEGPSPAIDALADRVVQAFDPFRAPLSPDDLARRRKGSLTERQDGHLVRWGYPYVFEDFFFHLTLTRRLAPDAASAVRAAVADRLADAADRPLRIDALCLFEQPARDRPFTLRRRFPLHG